MSLRRAHWSAGLLPLLALAGLPGACTDPVSFSKSEGGEAGAREPSHSSGGRPSGSGGRGSSTGGKDSSNGSGGDGGAHSGGGPNSGGSSNASGGAKDESGGSPSDGGAESSGGSASGGSAAGGSDSTGGSGPVDCTSCDPIPVISGLRKLRSFTVSGSYAYFVDTLLDDLNLERGAQLKRAALSGGAATPLTLTTLGDSGSALSVQGSYVYTTLTDDTHSSQVGRVPLLSGTSVEAVSGSPNYINAIRTNSTHAFGIWSLSQQHFTRVPLAGGTSNHIAQTPTFDWIDYEVDETFAYFLSPSGVARAPVEANDGGGSAEIGPAPQTGETFNALSVAGQGTVVIATNQRLLAVTDFSKDGSPIAAGGYFANVVADADYAYFFMGDTESCLSSKLYEIPLDGGTKPRHLATTPGCPSDAVLGSEGVYWTSPMRDAIVHAPR